MGVWTEEELEGDARASAPPTPDELLQQPMDKLHLKNVQKVPMKPDFAKRKCAMADGEFEDYDGPLWECKCGTLYHEACLKVQAVFAGKCQICDRPFRDRPQ